MLDIIMMLHILHLLGWLIAMSAGNPHVGGSLIRRDMGEKESNVDKQGHSMPRISLSLGL